MILCIGFFMSFKKFIDDVLTNLMTLQGVYGQALTIAWFLFLLFKGFYKEHGKMMKRRTTVRKHHRIHSTVYASIVGKAKYAMYTDYRITEVFSTVVSTAKYLLPFIAVCNHQIKDIH